MSSSASVPGRSASSLVTQIVQSLPTLATFTVLGGLMLWGHFSGWKLPSAASFVGQNAKESADDWCAAHSVPESLCVECKSDLMAKSPAVEWCKVHGVAVCPLCHPEVAQVKGKPRVPSYDVAAALALLPRPENNSKAAWTTRRLQFASAQAAEKAGVEVDVVGEQPMTDAVLASGEITFDPTGVAHLSTRAGGTVWRSYKVVGDRVKPGDVLALIDAAQVGQAKAEYLQASAQTQLRQRNLDRLKDAGGAVAQKQIIEAESALQDSEIRVVTTHQALVNLGFTLPPGIEQLSAKQAADSLRFLGIPTDLVSETASQSATANLIPLVAPQAGLVVDCHVVAGEVVASDKTLFVLADVERMCLTLHVPQEQARYMRPGLPVRFAMEEGGPEDIGKLVWVSAAVDERTRTLRLRANLANPDGKFKDKSYVSARVVLREEPKAVVVPRESVQATGDSQLVFVRDKDYLKDGSPKVFHVRQVRVGAKSAKHVEILAGVLPGEVIATQGSAVLLAELLRGSLGAGCGCHE